MHQTRQVSARASGTRNPGIATGAHPAHHGYHGAGISLSHHAEETVRETQYEKCVTWHVEQVAYFQNRFKGLDESGKSLLNKSMVMFDCGMKCGNLHLEHDLPIALTSGGKGTLKQDRRLRFPKETPLCNLYLFIPHRMEIEEKSFGDSTGQLPGLG